MHDSARNLKKAKDPKRYNLDGKEYVDKMVITTKLKVGFFQKLKNLFKPLLVVEHHLYLMQPTPENIGTQYGYKFMSEEEYKKLNEKK